jgi:hypothetical protein
VQGCLLAPACLPAAGQLTDADPPTPPRAPQGSPEERFLGMDRASSGNLPTTLLPLLKEIWKQH